MADNQTVILRVALDEGKTEERLAKLVLDLEATKRAQADLNILRKAGVVSDAQYAQQTVALRTQLTGQRAEQTALTKNLDLYRTAVNDTGGSYKALQAQLSLAQRQYQALDGSAENSTETTQALAATIDGLRNTLKATDAQQSLFVRNVGNYPDGKELTGLIQQLVKLEEETKRGTQTTDEAARAQMKIAGFRTQAMQAAASEGKSYEETTNLIKNYSAAIRPAVVNLVQLEEEQKIVAETAGEASEAVQRIGFRINALQKDISAVPAETKKLSTGLKEVAAQNSLVASATEKYTSVKDKFTQASNLAKLAIGGEVTALGLLRVALIATGLGALVVVLGSVVTFLTKTAEGTRLVENVMAQVSATVNVVIDRFGAFGKAVTQVLSGDFSGAANTARGAFKGIGDEIEREVKIAGDLSKAQQQLDRDTANNIDTNKRLLNEVERLKNVRDNEFNTIQKRQKANEDAYAVELTRENTLSDLARRRIAILKAQIDQRGGEAKASLEALREYKEAQNELSDIQEDAAGKQNELITNRYQLTQELVDKEIAARASSIAVQTAQLAKQLQLVRVNSDEELALLQKKLELARQAELNVKKLTNEQKKLADAKYESDSLALTLDFNRRRLTAALQAQSDLTAAQLAGLQTGSEEALRLQAQQIEEQRRLSLAALSANADNTAAIAKINATAANQQRQLEYADATRLLNDYLDQKRQAVELDYAQGIIKEGEYQRRLAAITKAGVDAQTVVNTDYRQDNAENQKKGQQYEVDQARTAAAGVKRQEEVKQEIRQATVDAAINHTDTIINLFGEESAAGQAALALKKVLGLAEIGLNLQKELSANALAGAKIAAEIPPPAGPILGTAYTIAKDALAITAAAAAAAAILKFERGGIAQGPSHAQGGIPLYYRGRPAGIEIEGGEPVLHRGVSQNPLLLSLASTVNQLAGGRALVPNFPMARMALGGVAAPLLGPPAQVAPIIDYGKLAAAMSRVHINTRVTDINAAQGRGAFTASISDS